MTTSSIPVVLVPGLACSARVWEPVLDVVWSRGPVLVADTRCDDSVEDMADRLLASAPPRFALVGVSMGGYVNFQVLRQAPERVLGAVFLSTSARADTVEQVAGRQAQIRSVEMGGFDALVDAAFPALVDPSHRRDERLLDFWRSMALTVGPEAFVRQLRACARRPDSRSLLAAISCPAAVVHGAGDQLIGPGHGAEIAAGIQGALHTVVPGCGHLPTAEAPAAVSQSIEALLALL
ncbi:MAG TPA: alpha/beta hydrolase [Acidimicrobiales bacterium]|nr:alpha/beta hydrolase [Acidimicrobiales bacterium]